MRHSFGMGFEFCYEDILQYVARRSNYVVSLRSLTTILALILLSYHAGVYGGCFVNAACASNALILFVFRYILIKKKSNCYSSYILVRTTNALLATISVVLPTKSVAVANCLQSLDLLILEHLPEQYLRQPSNTNQNILLE